MLEKERVKEQNYHEYYSLCRYSSKKLLYARFFEKLKSNTNNIREGKDEEIAKP